MFVVYLKSGRVKRYFYEVETEEEAHRLCEEEGWEWMDENGFLWDMDYEEKMR